jgi:hypothetical protein
VPTLEEFKDRFLDGYARANRQKPSGIAAKETVLNVHLVPMLGSTRLDAITTEHVQQLKHQLRSKAPKTVNNVLTVLNVLLKKAAEWGVIERTACSIRLLPIPKASAGFHDFDEYERLVEAAMTDDHNAYLIVLLGGEAGLRCGEMMALEWSDVDLAKRQLRIERSDWKGHVTATKGGRVRYVPLTARACDRSQGASSSPWRSGAVPAGRITADTEDGAGLRTTGGSAHTARQGRCASTSSSCRQPDYADCSRPPAKSWWRSRTSSDLGWHDQRRSRNARSLLGGRYRPGFTLVGVVRASACSLSRMSAWRYICVVSTDS